MADTGVLPEYAADAHASSHGPDQCDTHGAVRQEWQTGWRCRMLQRIYLPKVTRSAMFTRAMCPSTGNGDTSSTRPTRSVGTGAPALQWGQHSPTADGSKASAAVSPGLQGRCVPLQPMWTSHPPGPTAKVTSFRQAMFSAAEYEAIELAADGLMASLTVANGDVTHTPTPLRGSDPEIDFGTRKDVMNPSVGLKPNNLGIGARKDLRYSSVAATTAHLELGKRTGLATLCAEAKDQVLEETYPDLHMRAASMTAGEEIEASDEVEQVTLGATKEHGEAGVPLTCAVLSAFPTTARTSASNHTFDMVKGCQFLTAGAKATKEGLHTKVASQAGDQTLLFPAIATWQAMGSGSWIRKQHCQEAALATLQTASLRSVIKQDKDKEANFAHRSLRQEALRKGFDYKGTDSHKQGRVTARIGC